ncbi:MAG: DNA cytosine methyltransferase, partial [Candidatus Bathyarchaeia archaeon]
MIDNMERQIVQLASILQERMKDQKSINMLASQILKGAQGGLELKDSFEKWLNDRFRFQLLWLDKDDYSKALIRALWLAPVFAGTDFGGSRQRDIAQVWTDTARGFLGEIAFSKFLFEKFNIETKVDVRRGEIEEFLPSDVTQIRFPQEDWRQLPLKISVKTTKFNGRWLDLPGAQFDHSDIFVLVKIGILRQHFLAFLKAISFLRDKLFIVAKNLGELNDESAKTLWDEIPEFEPIPAYIAGFLYKRNINLPIHTVKAELKGKKRKRIVVTQGIGLFSTHVLRETEDILSPPAQTYSRNFHHVITDISESFSLNRSHSIYLLGDITEVDFNRLRKEEVDVVIGGPPCQDFSVVRGPAKERQGIEVRRGRLYAHFVRALTCLQPKVFVFENVPGLKSANGGKAYETILEDFSKLNLRWGEIRKIVGNNLTDSIKNYSVVFSEVVDCASIGVPQKRKRLIMIGVREDLADWITANKLRQEIRNILLDGASLFRKYPLT